MDAGDFVFDQVDRLLSRVVHADVELVFHIIAFAHRCFQFVWNISFAHFRDPHSLFEIGDWQNAWHDRHVNACFDTAIAEPIVINVVVKQLGDDDVRARIDFTLQVF